MTRLSVETIESVAQLEGIEPEWRAVWRRDPNAGPFQGPDWLLPWTKRLWGGGRLHVLTVHHGEELVGLAPMFLWGSPMVRLSFLGVGVSDQLGMIARPPFESEASRLVLEHLARTPAVWQVCEMDELRPGSLLLRTKPPGGIDITSTTSSICPVLALPRSMDELIAGLAPKFRKNLRQAETRLLREGSEFITAQPDNIPDYLSELFRLHTARWSLRREPGMLGEGLTRQFHVDVAERMGRQGTLRLHAIRLRGQIIAVQYNLWHKGRLCYYLSGFDPQYARFSPGSVLLAWTIRAAIDDGARELDFLRQREQYKYQWGARDRANIKLEIRPQSACARDVA